MILAITMHLLSAVVWVGGMFFAYMVLRPVTAVLLEPPVRLTVWVNVFKRFFPWVWAAVIVLLGTGLWMVIIEFGGPGKVGMHIHIMLVLGIAMMAIFMHVYFGPFRRLQRAVAESNWPAGGKNLNQIRLLVATNLVLGLVVVVIAAGGRYL